MAGHFIDSPLLTCRFGLTMVPAVYLSSTSANCTTPSHPAGLVSVAISSNHIEFSQTTISFMYVHDAIPATATPAIGAVNQSLQIVIAGSNMLPGSVCHVESAEGAVIESSYATFISSSEIVCTVGAAGQSGRYDLRVASNARTSRQRQFKLHLAMHSQLCH